MGPAAPELREIISHMEGHSAEAREAERRAERDVCTCAMVWHLSVVGTMGGQRIFSHTVSSTVSIGWVWCSLLFKRLRRTRSP